MRDNKRSIEGSFGHPRFRAAYDFLLLREEAGEDLGGRGEWWTQFQLGDTSQIIQKASGEAQRPKKTRRRRRPKAKTES